MAANALIGALRVDLGLNSAQFQAGLKSAQTSLAGFSKAISVGLTAATAGIGAGLTAALASTRAALDKFGAIADQAKAAGLDPEFFQGFAYQARLAGVDTNALARAAPPCTDCVPRGRVGGRERGEWGHPPSATSAR